jgi:hypothetical protein
MRWNDDSWRDGYDDWKLASPYDEYEEDEDRYDHTDADLDILDYRYRCSCGHSWSATAVQVEAEIERQREYSEWEERENRRQWWRDLWDKTKAPFRLRRRQPILDDEIPF